MSYTPYQTAAIGSMETSPQKYGHYKYDEGCHQDDENDFSNSVWKEKERRLEGEGQAEGKNVK